jgi:hypothetical protein
MAGDTDTPLTFPFKVRQPSVPSDLIANLIDEYARDRDHLRETAPQPSQRAIFLGSRPLLWDGPRGTTRYQLRWYWRLAEHTLHLADAAKANALIALLETYGTTSSPRPPQAPPPAQDFYARLNELLGDAAPEAWRILREGGLALIG